MMLAEVTQAVTLDLEWWQTLIGILVMLGLSPAPWILGLATGRLQFTAPAERAHDKRVADLKETHTRELTEVKEGHARELEQRVERYDEMKESRDYYREARLTERDRADAVTEKLGEAVEVAKLTLAREDAYDKVAREGA